LFVNWYPDEGASTAITKSFEFERLAFVPQLLLSAVMIPLVLAKKDLPSTMLAQTFAFVTFNKVCTSQVRNRPWL
jgi:phosphatidylinositol glycan class M